MPDILSKEVEFNIHRICQRDGLSFAQIKAKTRKADIVKTRQEVMYCLHKVVGYSSAQVGRALGERDHKTVLHGCKAHKRRFWDNQNVVS